MESVDKRFELKDALEAQLDALGMAHEYAQYDKWSLCVTAFGGKILFSISAVDGEDGGAGILVNGWQDGHGWVESSLGTPSVAEAIDNAFRDYAMYQLNIGEEDNERD